MLCLDLVKFPTSVWSTPGGRSFSFSGQTKLVQHFIQERAMISPNFQPYYNQRIRGGSTCHGWQCLESNDISNNNLLQFLASIWSTVGGRRLLGGVYKGGSPLSVGKSEAVWPFHNCETPNIFFLRHKSTFVDCCLNTLLIWHQKCVDTPCLNLQEQVEPVRKRLQKKSVPQSCTKKVLLMKSVA